jgi:isopropylmalate/homocitrate/citramalate synthase
VSRRVRRDVCGEGDGSDFAEAHADRRTAAANSWMAGRRGMTRLEGS